MQHHNWSTYKFEQDITDDQGNVSPSSVQRLVHEHNELLAEYRLLRKVISHLDEREF